MRKSVCALLCACAFFPAIAVDPDDSTLYNMYLNWETSDWGLVTETSADNLTKIVLCAVKTGEANGTATTLETVVKDDLVVPSYWASYYGETDITRYGDGTYSFFIEIWGNTEVGGEMREELLFNGYERNLATLENLREFVSTDLHPTQAYWNAVVVPEPSSGLLTLIGGALLALRRRRRRFNRAAAGLALAAACGVCGPAEAVIDVVSDNCYTMLKLTSTEKNTPVAMPFVALEAATNQSPTSVAEAVDVNQLSPGDSVLVYNFGEDSYNEYVLTDQRAWEPSAMLNVGADGTVRAVGGSPADAMKIEPGYGSWLIRQSTAKPLVLHGQLPYAAEVEVRNGANLVGALGLGDTDLNDCSVDWAAAGVVESKVTVSAKGKVTLEPADSIVIGSRNSRNQLYFYRPDADSAPRWGHPFRKVSTVIPHGEAVWLLHDGAGFTYNMTQMGY